MAKKDRINIGNARPTESFKTRTLKATSGTGEDCGGNATGPTSATMDIIRYNHFEVGNGTQSSFSGTDSYGNAIKNATFSEREPLMMRYNYVNDLDDTYIDGDTSNELDSILGSEYFYDQDTKSENKGKKRIPRFEKQVRPFITYDEEYFQHVYNWPTSHTLKPRVVGGFAEETKECYCAGNTSDTSITKTMYALTGTYNAEFTLDQTKSEIYWVDGDSDGNWIERKLELDPASGRITGDSTRPWDVTATIKLDFEWDDDPNTAGIAVGTLSWGNSGASFKQSGERGSSSETITIGVGDYMMNLTNNQGGYDVNNAGDKIEFYDGDGTDANAEVRLTVQSTAGTNVTARFDSQGNIVVTGTPSVTNVSTPVNTLTDKLGDPIIYHGGTGDNCIFFNYSPENTPSTLPYTEINHNFNDNSNVTNSLTSSGSNFSVSAKSESDPGGEDSSKERKHYVVNVTGLNISNKDDLTIMVDGNKTASGVKKANIGVAKIKLISGSKFKVWFANGNGKNTFVRKWSISYGHIPDPNDKYNKGSTTNLLAIGDRIKNHRIENIVNYVVDTALKRSVSKSSAKGVIDRRVGQNTFKSFNAEYTDSDYNNTKGWLKLNSVKDLTRGMSVFGKGIYDGTRITGVDQQKRRIFLTKPTSAQTVKNVKFTDTGVNRVSVHTLCYAVLDGAGDDFDTDETITSEGGVQVVVRAGKGIRNRSAVVGVYNSKNRKEIKYSPIFYSSDDSCEQETDSTDEGDFILGTVVWDDDTRISERYLMSSPKTQDAYKIASIYLAFTRAPIDKDTFYRFFNEYQENRNIIDLYASVNNYVIQTLGGRKAAIVFDDVCRDEIVMDYYKAYDNSQELGEIGQSVDEVINAIDDECVLKFQDTQEEEISVGGRPFGTLESVKERFEEVMEKSLSQSSFLSDSYYKKLVTDDDSLLKRLQTASESTRDAVPKETEIDNLPPSVEGTDNSGTVNLAYSYRDLPPATDRVKYFVEDLLIADDRYMSPKLDLDPYTTINQPRFIFRSKPCWDCNKSGTEELSVTGSETLPDGTVSAANINAKINVTVNRDSDNYVTTITTQLGTIASTLNSNLVEGTDPSGAPGDPGYTVGSTGSGCNYSVVWKPPAPKDEEENLYVGERSESMGSGAYYESTNASLPPELRDLDYKDRDSDSDILDPDEASYPKTIWEPNVSYQMDFYKLFWFRLNELTELVGETLLNFGNPYNDNPVKTKLTEDITPSTTSIKVQSTAGFLSSGYLIIPKYNKKIATDEGGNNNPLFSYSGEELIYYGSKTSTSFDNISRQALESNFDKIQTISVTEIEKNVKYKIITLGDTNWKKAGGKKNAKVGDVFVAKRPGKGTGEVEVFGSNQEKNPDPKLLAGAVKTPKVSVISSYEKGFSVAQHPVYRLKEM